MESRKQERNIILRLVHSRIARTLAMAPGVLLLGALAGNAAHAQSTVGMIHGQAPAGDVVVARSNTGFRHHTMVRANGRYKIRGLPLGVYSVTLKHGDKVVDMYHRVPLTVSRGVEVNFACPHDKCAAPGNNAHSS